MATIVKLQQRMLQRVANLMEKNGIPFWLESGTLLGWIREKRHLSEHKNVDIAIDGTYLNRLLALRKKLLPQYKLRDTHNHSGRDWIDSDTTRINVIRIWENNNNAMSKIIVTIKFKHNNTYRWVDRRCCKSVPSHFFDRLEKINRYGRYYPIPSHPEDYLRMRYGDWKIPKHPWFSRIDDLSIINDDKIKSIPPKQIVRSKKRKRIKLNDNYLIRMKHMLFDSLDIFERNGIKYWIDDGTLLGIIRDGDLIPWDHDE